MLVFSVLISASTILESIYNQFVSMCRAITMRILILTAILFVSACGSPNPETQSDCLSESICAGVFLEGETVFLYVRNNSLHAVKIPRISGVNSTDAQFLVASADNLDEARQTIETVLQIPADEADFVDLAPRGIVGVTLKKNEFKQLYLMRQGCHDVNVYFLTKIFNKKTENTDQDEVRYQKSRICF